MVNGNSEKLTSRLETLREASRRACEHVLKKRSDVVAVYVIGSVARGNVHERSDIDMMVVIEDGDDFDAESLQESGCSVDIVYAPLKLWEEQLYHSWGSDWEFDVSSVVDSLVIYDPKGTIQKAREELAMYPEERRLKRIRQTHNNMIVFSGAVEYHYMNKNYDIESVFSKLYAMEALRILFPVNRVYLRDHKRIFEQVEELPENPPDYVRKILSLLWFKSQNVTYDEATWVINTVSETKKAIENKMRSLGPDYVKWLAFTGQ